MRKYALMIAIMLLLIVSYTLFNNLVDSFIFLPQDKVIAIFKENKPKFQKVATKLYNVEYQWSLRGKTNHYDEIRNDWEFAYTETHIQITIHDKESSEEIKNLTTMVEHEDNIGFILNELKFKTIVPNTYFEKINCVYFVKQSTYGFDSGIIYSPKSDAIDNPFITKLVEIEPSWFYYEQGDN